MRKLCIYHESKFYGCLKRDLWFLANNILSKYELCTVCRVLNSQALHSICMSI